VGAPSATSSPLRVFVRVKPTDDAPCFVVAADHKTLTATAPDVRARAKKIAKTFLTASFFLKIADFVRRSSWRDAVQVFVQQGV
jgi:hypothetical protein